MIGPATRSIDEVVVVIPANDEEQLIGECLESVSVAVRRLEAESGSPAVRVIVALDACRDLTATVVARHPFVETVTLMARNVGVARAAGVSAALSESRVPLPRVWIANTDADTRVPADWLTRQLTLARGELAEDESAQGEVDGVVGTVRPDPRDLTEAQYARWRARALVAASDRSVGIHGANLGVRAAAYVAVGGFAPLSLAEDVDLVERLRERGSRLVFTDSSWVVTSARTVGRAPGGFSEYVRVNY